MMHHHKYITMEEERQREVYGPQAYQKLGMCCVFLSKSIVRCIANGYLASSHACNNHAPYILFINEKCQFNNHTMDQKQTSSS